MMLKPNKYVYVQAYKHNKQIHRTWSNAYVLDVNEDYVTIIFDQSLVQESNKRVWQTKEPTVSYYFFNRWFNVNVMFRKEGIFYYVNIASPIAVDEEAIKYIDYDLDVKLYPDFKIDILDKNEFIKNSKNYNYSKEIIEIAQNSLNEVLQLIEEKKFPFNDINSKEELIKYHLQIFNNSN